LTNPGEKKRLSGKNKVGLITKKNGTGTGKGDCYYFQTREMISMVLKEGRNNTILHL